MQRSLDEAQSRLTLQRRAAEQWPAVPRSVLADLDQVRLELRSIERELSGDRSRSPHEEAPESIASRVNSVVFGHWRTTSNPTDTQRRALEVAREGMRPLVERLRSLIDNDMSRLDAALDAAGAPWTPGRRLDVP